MDLTSWTKVADIANIIPKVSERNPHQYQETKKGCMGDMQQVNSFYKNSFYKNHKAQN